MEKYSLSAKKLTKPKKPTATFVGAIIATVKTPTKIHQV
jgi:hypothetical protein